MKVSLSIILFLQISLAVVAKEIKVCKQCNYNTISAAIAYASSNDTILILKGTYNESTIVIDKPLVVIGMEGAIIDGKSKGDILLLRANNITVEGLKIENSGSSNVRDFAGIKVENSANCIIKDNELVHNYFAIYLSNSSDCEVSHNKINGHAIKESNSGNGIHLWKSNSIKVQFNEAYNHRDGIYLEFSEKCTIYDNISEGNLRYGLHFMFSHGNSYVCNTFRKNGAGVAVMYTKQVEMINNTFEENWGTASYGLLLKDISKSTIKGNKFVKNTVGVYMEGVSDVAFSANEFISNGWGIKLMGNSTSNKLTGNNFMDNTFDLVTNSFDMGKENFISDNFWDKYEGYDLDRNRIGDVPYRPVSLFSVYVERIPYSVILLRSFMVNLLNKIEQAVPAMIPETLMDRSPKMQKLLL